ncbi:MAG: hypothetical protein A3G32_00270 [Deltaproteobacteria bacterium RIFCSPLOWO2_12_FULL_40_28]|nr:MAG: hypothetical protein A3C45_03425 [Deltaproteobacteria bacterium RIFCSPHIGHO2_02_FULL_40_28]OGQ19158.1 MAG: hypothetical protein A3E27_02310 [Deltaproteobacteria bacterium RIFCSPHIGHO2_12_FULL_40_32]OGQ39774.1 MAG: hypothetical protein A3I69_07385 [Deltaproteobacteria bacterium RIFCSPLOWO2_02_FULL_40_36]OGQ53610.1 MAG: hypothetical protein A3G32_00270 [Deltaproteobacteria bacterium RIFCSPLOWO2_12_FULL_40_28]
MGVLNSFFPNVTRNVSTGEFLELPMGKRFKPHSTEQVQLSEDSLSNVSVGTYRNVFGDHALGIQIEKGNQTQFSAFNFSSGFTGASNPITDLDTLWKDIDSDGDLDLLCGFLTGGENCCAEAGFLIFENNKGRFLQRISTLDSDGTGFYSCGACMIGLSLFDKRIKIKARNMDVFENEGRIGIRFEYYHPQSEAYKEVSLGENEWNFTLDDEGEINQDSIATSKPDEELYVQLYEDYLS